jgi:hypothetical protein
MVLEMSDDVNQRGYTTVGVMGPVLTSRQVAALDDFLQSFTVLRHFLEMPITVKHWKIVSEAHAPGWLLLTEQLCTHFFVGSKKCTLCPAGTHSTSSGNTIQIVFHLFWFLL